MNRFIEKSGEKQNQRRKRFLEYLRSLPRGEGVYDNKQRCWVKDPNAVQQAKA